MEAVEVGDWTKIIENWDTILKTNRKVVIRSLRLGIPEKHRARVWSLLAGAAIAKKSANFTYQEALSEESSYEYIISCDVPRTFPGRALTDLPNFHQSLRNVLWAYSVVDRQVGYVQGMNFIAGMFLLRQEEEEAFWSFYAIMTQWQVPHRDFFVRSFPKLIEMSELIDWLIESRFPNIHECLKARGFSSILFIPQWFNTCFVSVDFEPEMSAFIFDQFLAYGVPPILSFGMTTLSLIGERVMDDNESEVLSWLTCPSRAEFMHNRQKVNVEWGKQWITTTEYHRLIKEMKQKKGLE